jgi:hypothetical protein
LPLLDSARRVLPRLAYTQAKTLINKFLVQLTVDCRRGFKRVNLCVKEDLLRALIIFETSRGLKRYQVVNEALEFYLNNYDLIKRLGPDNLRLRI